MSSLPHHRNAGPGERDPIAIIGMGCRFPGGARDPETFWSLLRQGVDGVIEVPPDRWSAEAFYSPDPGQPGTAVTRWGGFVQQPVTDFDAAFFGMSPREAAHLDPMQRWLLEVTWEALEDAGLPVQDLAGSATGVYVGVFTEDAKLFQLGDGNRHLIGPHTGTGTAMTMAANRLSYWFDLRGPSVALDTACSSSLVALHLACQSLWSGETGLALCGGANAMFRPEFTIAESKAGMLSPDGRCRTFDASANGYVRGEGAGMVVLKPLSAALRDGDRVHALILGTASNQDGRTQGITVPNGEAQEALMLDAFRRAGVSPGRVRYMEAHGTGTPVGDPIEAKALAAVLGRERAPGDRCIVGSVKTNIGHLEAAAGIAGLIKAVLCLERREIPPHLHFRQPNPDIPFDELPLRVPRELEPWPDEPGPRLAAVNSFGFGGANAHAVLASAPEPEDAPDTPGQGEAPWLVPLSARSPAALKDLAVALGDRLEEGAEGSVEGGLPDVAWTAALRRTHHEHRLATVARDREELARQLRTFAEGGEDAGLRRGTVPAGGAAPLVWVFSGMGPQWWAMGRQLLEREPVFRGAVERCDELLGRHADWSLLAEMTASEEASRMAETQISQPANFALQVGLATLLRSWGVEPDAIVGHSTGEAAAFWAAGVVDLEEAVRIIYHRSRLQHRTTGQGKLVAVGLPLEEARRVLGDRTGVSIAAVNSGSSVTLSGSPEVLEEVVAPLQEREVFCRFLRVDVPFHSHYMDPLRDDLLAALADLDPRRAQVPLYSTVTGGPVEGPELDAAYWWRNVREPVYFAAAVERLAADGFGIFLEIGPHPVLTGSIGEGLARSERDGVVLSTLRRKSDEQAGLLDTLGGLYVAGREVDWSAFHPRPRRLVDLPVYPWQRERHWDESADSVGDRLEAPVHPLLGRRRSGPRPEWRREVGRRSVAFLEDHQVHGGVVFPGAGFVEMGFAAVREVAGAEAAVEMEDVRFERGLFLPEGEVRMLHTSFDPDASDFEIASRPLDREGWVLHARGRLLRARSAGSGAPEALDPEALRNGLGRNLPAAECYEELARRGFQYGPAFQGLDEAWAGDGELLARIRVAPSLAAPFHVSPPVLDAAFQALLLVSLLGRASDATFMPVAIQRLVLHRSPSAAGWAHARLHRSDERGMEGDVILCDEDGRPSLEIRGVEVAALEAGTGGEEMLERLLGSIEWQIPQQSPQADQAEVEPAPADGTWLLFGDGTGVAEALARRLEAASASCATVRRGEAYESGSNVAEGRPWRLDPTDPDHFRRLLREVSADGAPPCRGIVHLWSLDAPPTGDLDVPGLMDAQEAGPTALLHLLQALDGAGWSHTPRLWVVTRGGQATGGDDGAVAVAQAPVWGFARTLFHQEHAEMAGGLVDLEAADPDAEDAENAADLLAAVFQGRVGEAPVAGEDQIALRGGRPLVPRLVPAKRLAEGVLRPRLRPDGCYLITGGLGGLGLLYARWMVSRGAHRLVLTGRTPLPPRSRWASAEEGGSLAGRIQAVRELEALGASVRTAALDAADGAALDALLKELRDEGWGPVRGVFHAAGVSAPQLLLNLEPEQLRATLEPKLAGGWLLHDRLRDEPLDFFVLFSSVAGLGFSMGMADYAAGNAFLDGLAAYRRSRGLAANSLDWGPWGEVGMASPEEVARAFVQKGFLLIHPAEGLKVMERVFEHDPVQSVVLGADWSVAPQRNYPTGPPPLLRLVEEEDTGSAADPEDASVSWRERLAAAGAGEREEVLGQHLRETVARVLRMEPSRVDPAASLGSFGLDSMLAVELRNRVESTLGAGPSLVELLQGASVIDLAEVLLPRLDLPAAGAVPAAPGAASPQPAAPAPAAAEPPEDGGPWPLSRGQRALWFLHQRDPEGSAYNVAFAGRITTPVDGDALRGAFQALVDRHPALRTRFRLQDGRPVQEVAAHRDVAFTRVAMDGAPDGKLRRRVDEAYHRPFDLEDGPLLRVYLFSRRPDDHVLLLTAHHIAVDGWSLFLLLDELRALYPAMQDPALRDGASSPLPPPSAVYVDHVRREEEMLAGPKGERLWDYWSRRLTPPPPPLELPTDRPRPRVQTSSGASHTFVLGRGATEGLREMARAEGTTLFVALVAVLAALLHRVSGQESFALGGTTAGRDHADLRTVVGHFVNSLVLDVDFSGHPSFRELLRQARETVLSAFEHQGYPFPLLVERLQSSWDPSRSPLFQVSLVLQNLPGLERLPEFLTDSPGETTGADFGGFRMEPYPLDQQAGQHELEMEVYERPESLLVVFQYNPDLFDADTIETLARRLEVLAAEATGRPDERVEELGMISEGERRESARRRAADQRRLKVSRRRAVPLAAEAETAGSAASAVQGSGPGEER